MNGTILQELRELARKPNTPIKVTVSLLASVVADMAEKIEHDNNVAAISSVTESVNTLGAEFQQFRTQMTSDVHDLKKIVAANPMVQLGEFIRNHKTWAVIAGFGFVFFANLWFISGFRQGVMEWLNFPDAWIKLLVP